MSACFFDVDGTLTRTSLFSAAGYYLMSQQNPLIGAARLMREVVRFPSLAVAEVLDRGLFNERLFMVYRGMSQDRLLCLADEVVDRVLVPSLFPSARRLVEGCKQSGLEVFLVSGSPDFLVKPLGQRLGIPTEHCFGNRVEFVQTVCTGRIVPPVLAGPAKAALIRNLVEKRGLRLADCYAYSDDSADAPMLSVVGHPAAVNPGPRLRAMAQAQRWPIIELN
jgi:HAD superfamily hydrolase (TIGR01490 family)